MKPNKWKPKLAGNPDCPLFYIEVLLECPACHHFFEFKSGLRLLRGQDGGGIPAAIENVVAEIKAQMACSGCGVVSCLPMASLRALRLEIKTKVNDDWVEKEIKGLQKTLKAH